LPTEDQGYAVLVSVLPEGASQPRSMEVATKVNAILEKTKGIDAWVHIGGYSVLDTANVPNISTTFVVYKSWKERGNKLNQDQLVAGRGRELAGIQEEFVSVVTPPRIRGLGQSGGFQMMVEDRTELGLAELQRNTDELIQKGNAHPTLQRLATTFSDRSPQL